jgi:hypothetical protein
MGRLSWHAPRRGMLAFNPQTRCNVRLLPTGRWANHGLRARHRRCWACDQEIDTEQSRSRGVPDGSDERPELNYGLLGSLLRADRPHDDEVYLLATMGPTIRPGLRYAQIERTPPILSCRSPTWRVREPRQQRKCMAHLG